MAITYARPSRSYGGVFDEDLPVMSTALKFNVWAQVSTSPFWQQLVHRKIVKLPASLFHNVVVVEAGPSEPLHVIALVPVNEEDDNW